MSIRRPAIWHTLIEGRTLLEFSASTLGLPLLLRAPKGERHTVMVLPGFLASDFSTKALRQFLKLKGYHAVGWGLGRNLGQHIVRHPRLVSKALLEKVLHYYQEQGEPISLIGWSLGGILAREIARLMPEQIRCVITLGSPFQDPEKAAPMAAKIFKALNKERMGGDFSIPSHLNDPLEVPSTAIYSRTDGIAHWLSCKHHNEDMEHRSENIEVRASHLGYGHHPAVLWAIAARLAQPADHWTPLYHQHLPRWLFPDAER